jgi:hypothetical protein
MSLTKSSISNFTSTFKDLARPSRFEVIITLPNLVKQEIDVDEKILILTCHVAQLPGRTFAPTEQKTYGPIEKYPFLTTYNDLDLTFYVDQELNIKRIFDMWMNVINPKTTNNFEYKENYCSDIQIKQYDMKNEVTYAVKCVDAYPISMNQLDLDWSSESFHNLNVTFAYTRWEQVIKK